ncbi:MAG: hypothetical protein K6T83_08105 [Alicyclobacillus sp.]|nr:hypothetical protein [Alicyclobacillus sp.]
MAANYQTRWPLFSGFTGLHISGTGGRFGRNTHNFNEAKKVISEYVKWRPLREVEEQYLFDVYKLSVLIDCVWYFERGDAQDFYERRKVEFLNGLGRERFYLELFH